MLLLFCAFQGCQGYCPGGKCPGLTLEIFGLCLNACSRIILASPPSLGVELKSLLCVSVYMMLTGPLHGMCVCVCTGTCEGQRSSSGVSFGQSLLVFSRQLLEHSDLSRLAAWWAPRDPLVSASLALGSKCLLSHPVLFCESRDLNSCSCACRVST